MTDRTIGRIATPEPRPGTGILHPFPTPELAHVDPFVFLDTGAPRHLGENSIYVGPHPHRGVQPVSLVFQARIEHRDSLGNHRTVSSGGMQWLAAGSGALHEEVLDDDDGVFHMAQLWVNLPAALQMAPPEHHAVPAEGVPVITDVGTRATVRLFAGSLAGQIGPAPRPTPILVAHAVLEAGGQVTVPVQAGWNAAFCVVAGSVDVEGHPGLGPGATPVFNDDGDTISLTSVAGGEVLVMAGEPIGEPIAMGGGFVMSTPEQISQAFEDYRTGLMGRLEPSR
jgi:hypothetical protein